MEYKYAKLLKPFDAHNADWKKSHLNVSFYPALFVFSAMLLSIISLFC